MQHSTAIETSGDPVPSRRSPYTPPAFTRWVGRHRSAVLFLVDALSWLVALTGTILLRYEYTWSRVNGRGLLVAMVLAVVCQGVLGTYVGLYRRHFRYGSFEEAYGLAGVALVTGGLLLAVSLLHSTLMVPRSVPPLATSATICGAVMARSMWRLYHERRKRPFDAESIIVVGAGESAYKIVKQLLSSPDSPFLPVAMLDDDPQKASLRVHSVGVQGAIDDLPGVAARLGVVTVLLAIPSGGKDLVRRVDESCRSHGLRLFVLPHVRDLFGEVLVSDIRPVSNTDLLGRVPADIAPGDMAHYVRGKRVLVTGAGGSIGSELCRQLALLEPASLIMLDRDESGLHAVQLSIGGRAMLDSPDLVLADIRDAERVMQVFLTRRPEVVFHAAALKHLPLLEGAPAEAWKSNVVGTQNVIDAAVASGVRRFVNISTDKAADPISVLGYSKRITERLTAAAGAEHRGSWVSVRFGNVLGSRGSVLTAFRAQADRGGVITVTHPEVTRYFMTVEEAVRLTVLAGSLGESGEVMVLDMGEPVRILDVAERFAAQHQPPLPIEFTGLRPGEKLHEVLLANDETVQRRVHPLIAHVVVPPLQFESLADVMVPGRVLTSDVFRRAAELVALAERVQQPTEGAEAP